MKINCASNSYINFTGSSKLIKDADKLCRIITEEFPAFSGTRTVTFKSVKKDKKFINYLSVKLLQNRWARDDAWDLFKPDETLDFYRRFVENMKKYKNINCDDYTKLAQIILKVNNVDSVKASLLRYDMKKMDHVVLLVNAPKRSFGIFYKNQDLKNIIVIDPWLGFADYANNAVVRYNSEFSGFLGLQKNYVPIHFDVNPNPEISQQTVDYMKKTYPQFIQKKDFMKIV